MGLNMIKVLATDLDGTLFYPKRKKTGFTKKNKKFLQEFLKKGNRVILVSGRNYHMCKRLSDILGYKLDMIGCNGSVVLKDNEFLFDNPMDKNLIKEFLQDNFKSEKVVSWTFFTDKYPMVMVPVRMNFVVRALVKLYFNLQGVYKEDFVIGYEHLEKILNDDDIKIYKMMAVYGVGKKKIEVARVQREKLYDAYGTKFEILWSKEAIEFMKKGVNKAEVLTKYLEQLQIEKNEVAVIGDSGNDVPMFEAFENSFAMAQAPEEVRQKAKIEVKGVYCIKDHL